MEPDAVDATDAEEGKAVVVLQPSELALNGGAALVQLVATALLVHGQTPLDQLDTFDDDDLLPLSETIGIPPLKIGHPDPS